MTAHGLRTVHSERHACAQLVGQLLHELCAGVVLGAYPYVLEVGADSHFGGPGDGEGVHSHCHTAGKRDLKVWGAGSVSVASSDP